MKIITDCPLCGNDFMYDPNFDYHLVRSNMPQNCGTLGLDENDVHDHDIQIVICQECDENNLRS